MLTSIALDIYPTSSMKAAIITGIFGTEQTILPSCATGNCNWTTPYTSLAICSTCSDTTDQLKVMPFNKNTCEFCNASLPDGTRLEPGQFCGAGAPGGNVTKVVPAKRNLLFNVGGFNFIAKGSGNMPEVEGCNDFRATECRLNFCLQTYSAVNTAGQWSERVLSSWTNETGKPRYGDGSDDHTSHSSTIMSLDPPLDKVATQQIKTFTVSVDAMVGIRSYIDSLFNGNGFAGLSESIVRFENDEVQALYQTSNITKMMANVARSMTTDIRTVGYSQTVNGQGATGEYQSANGTAWEVQAFVHVRWAWLSLLIALEILSLIVVLATVILSARNDIPTWKASALPVLRCRLTPDTEQSMSSARQVQQMKRVGHQTMVVLKQHERGATLHQV